MLNHPNALSARAGRQNSCPEVTRRGPGCDTRDPGMPLLHI